MRRCLALGVLLSLLAVPVRGAEGQPYAALTFDDGPSGKYTQRLLDGLAYRGVACTFLLCGYRMEQYPELTQRIYQEGHEIGYHGFSHDSMKTMSRRRIGQELMDSQALLPQGCRPVFFRPPGGVVTDGVHQVAKARNLALLSWSVDPKDWATRDRQAVKQAVLDQVRNGDIILLHDMSASSVDAALDIVDVLQSRGFQLVTVSQLAKLRKTPVNPGEIYTRFPPPEDN